MRLAVCPLAPGFAVLLCGLVGLANATNSVGPATYAGGVVSRTAVGSVSFSDSPLNEAMRQANSPLLLPERVSDFVLLLSS